MDAHSSQRTARFETDGSLGTLGSTAKLTRLRARQVTGRVTRADAPKVLECNDTRWQLEAYRGGTHLSLWHNIDPRFFSPGAAGWHTGFDVLDRLLSGTPMVVVRRFSPADGSDSPPSTQSSWAPRPTSILSPPDAAGRPNGVAGRVMAKHPTEYASAIVEERIKERGERRREDSRVGDTRFRKDLERGSAVCDEASQPTFWPRAGASACSCPGPDSAPDRNCVRIAPVRQGKIGKGQKAR